MCPQKKLLCPALLIPSLVWIFYGGRWAICAVLLGFFALFVYAIARMLWFYCVSDAAYAKVIRVRAVERTDSDGYSNWTYYLTFQLTLANREYVSEEEANVIAQEVGAMVRLRYRRTDPQQMHSADWGTLFGLAMALAMVTAGIYMTLHWRFGSLG